MRNQCAAARPIQKLGSDKHEYATATYLSNIKSAIRNVSSSLLIDGSLPYGQSGSPIRANANQASPADQISKEPSKAARSALKTGSSTQRKAPRISIAPTPAITLRGRSKAVMPGFSVSWSFGHVLDQSMGGTTGWRPASPIAFHRVHPRVRALMGGI